MATSSLNQLRDIHLPPVPSIFPLAPAWYAVIIVLILTLGAITYSLWKILQRKRQFKEINQLINQIEHQYHNQESDDTLAQLSIVLKRVAILRLGKHKPHALFGQQWLNFLDQHGNTSAFSTGVGQILENVYQKQAIINPDDLFHLVRQWIRRVL
jgi:hypothetical protein